MISNVSCPVYSSRLGVSNIGDIVDMPCSAVRLGNEENDCILIKEYIP